MQIYMVFRHTFLFYIHHDQDHDSMTHEVTDIYK